MAKKEKKQWKYNEEIAMETRKLFYEDCHLNRFSAQVLSCEPVKGRYGVILSATAFYPEGGGQAGDTGVLGTVRVLDTREQGEAVLHLCDGPLEVGSTVEGVIDYERRFDLMQQHSGDHIVSGIIYRRFGYHNVGFHMGTASITLDFDGVIPPEVLAEIELEANAVIWKNLPVRGRVPEPEELAVMHYRSKKALPWPVRIVEIPGCDACACCGVHVGHTGEIGVIKLISTVGLRGGSRVEMLCGKRGFQLMNAVFDQNRQVSQAFSAQLLETGAAARWMNEQLAAHKYRIVGLERQLFHRIAADYAGKGDVLHFAEGLDSVAIRELADIIADSCGGRAAVFSGEDGEGYAFCLVTRNGDLRALGKEMNQALSGRGGGKPAFQQGRVGAEKAQIEAFFAQR